MIHRRWLVHAEVYPIDSVELRGVDYVPEELRTPVIIEGVTKEVLDILSYAWEYRGKQIFEKLPKPQIKKEAHKENDLHMAAHIWIFNSKWEVLIQKRTDNKDSYPWLWDISVAGHISSGETMLTGAFRETSEELGMNTTIDDLVPIGFYREEITLDMPWYEDGWFNNELNEIFVMRFDGDISNLKIQPEEVAEIKYVSLEWLEQQWNTPEGAAMFTPKTKEYRQMVIDGIRKQLSVHKK